MTAVKVIGLLLLITYMCYAKKHHHKHHKASQGDAKSGIRRPNFHARGTKKQSLGMPFNNLDQQGLGGEPVGHIHDATEGVGGLGGDSDGMPVGMGAGAEPLGMSKGGKGGSIDIHGGAMQGISEDGEGIHGNDEMARPFNEQEGGEMEGAHGGHIMEGGKGNEFMTQGMMPGGNNMGNMGNMGAGEMMQGGAGNFMEQPEEGGAFRGPKKDPLGGEIQPFNEEYKNDDKNGKNLLTSGNNGMSSHGGGMSSYGGGMNKYSEGMGQEEGGAEGAEGGAGGEMEQMELQHGKNSNSVEDMDHKFAHTKATISHRKRPRSKSQR